MTILLTISILMVEIVLNQIRAVFIKYFKIVRDEREKQKKLKAKELYSEYKGQKGQRGSFFKSNKIKF